MTYAQPQTLQIQVDKGNVQVELAVMNQPYDISVKTNEACSEEPVIQKNGDSVKVVHSAKCQRGSDIVIKLSHTLSSTLVVADGLIKLIKPAAALKNLAEMRAVVDVGMIQTAVPGLVPARINNYAGSEVTYKKLNASALPTVKLRVQSGLIEI